jgi:hypothetical protein
VGQRAADGCGTQRIAESCPEIRYSPLTGAHHAVQYMLFAHIGGTGTRTPTRSGVEPSGAPCYPRLVRKMDPEGIEPSPRGSEASRRNHPRPINENDAHGQFAPVCERQLFSYGPSLYFFPATMPCLYLLMVYGLSCICSPNCSGCFNRHCFNLGLSGWSRHSN